MQLVAAVERMLALQARLLEAKTPHERTALERQIKAADGNFDRIVYALFGLTTDDVRMIEAAT